MRSARDRSVVGSTPPARVRYWLPAADGGSWRFDVPATLARCIGRYARIPEYVGQSHLLPHAAIGSEAED